MPVVQVRPSSQTVTVGQNTSLFCSVDGSPTSVIKWKKFITPMVNKTVKVTTGKISTLYLIDITEKDFGVYFCQATNIAGIATSSNATIIGLYTAITDNIFDIVLLDQ